MRLVNQLAQWLEKNPNSPLRTWASIAPLVDLTLLNEQARATDIANLTANAEQHGTAAVCVLPKHLPLVVSTTTKRATVLNFPSGEEPQTAVVTMLDELLGQQRPDEIDYVFPYQTYLAGQTAQALRDCADLYQRCQAHQVIFKVILETGAFANMDDIYQLAVLLIKQGCDFLKTSTGKITQGASVPAAFALLSAITDSGAPCGIKLSGGIKTLQQASIYMQLAESMHGAPLNANWFRIGTSQILS